MANNQEMSIASLIALNKLKERKKYEQQQQALKIRNLEALSAPFYKAKTNFDSAVNTLETNLKKPSKDDISDDIKATMSALIHHAQEIVNRYKTDVENNQYTFNVGLYKEANLRAQELTRIISWANDLISQPKKMNYDTSTLTLLDNERNKSSKAIGLSPSDILLIIPAGMLLTIAISIPVIPLLLLLAPAAVLSSSLGIALTIASPLILGTLISVVAACHRYYENSRVHLHNEVNTLMNQFTTTVEVNDEYEMEQDFQPK
jgi:hypothetical protein